MDLEPDDPVGEGVGLMAACGLLLDVVPVPVLMPELSLLFCPEVS